MRDLDIVHVSSAHPWTDNRVHLREAASAARAGYRVGLIAVDSSVSVPETGVRVIRLLPRRPRLARMILNGLDAVGEAIRSGAPVVHLHDPELAWAVPVLRLLRRSVVFDAHEDLPDQVVSKAYIGPVSRTALRGVALIVVAVERRASRVVAATAAIAERYDASRTVIVQNFPRLRPVEASAGSVLERPARVVFIGALDVARGGHTLAEVPVSAAFPAAWRLDLAGTITNVSLRERFDDLARRGVVTQHGHVSPAAARDLLLEARVGIVTFHPTEAHLNALPTKMFEYMAAGLAVIVSDFPLWRSLLEPFDCATFVDPTDPVAIARAVAAYDASPERLERHGANAARAARDVFNWTSEEAALLEMYHALLPGRLAEESNRPSVCLVATGEKGLA